jgi:hypothetical protein
VGTYIRRRLALAGGVAVGALLFASASGAAAYALTREPAADPALVRQVSPEEALASVADDESDFALLVPPEVAAERTYLWHARSLFEAESAAIAADAAVHARAIALSAASSFVPLAAGVLYDIVAGAFPEDPGTAYRVVLCESRGDPATNTGNGYYGMWQFDLATWEAMGGAGLPSAASAEEQTARARMLYDARGWQPWGCR